jgi:hypothetical protein
VIAARNRSAHHVPAAQRRALKVALGVVLRFPTWQGFAHERVTDRQAVASIMCWLSALRSGQ